MNESAFATSREAGDLVVALVAIVVLAAAVGIWTVERWVKARRDARAQELRATRQAHRQSRLAEAAGQSRNDARVLAGRFRTRLAESEADRRLKAIGVDDGFHQWAERQQR